MIQFLRTCLLVSIALSPLGHAGNSAAQDEVVEPKDGGRRVIIGGLDIEDTSTKKVSPHEKRQNDTIEYFTRTHKALDTLSAGGQATVEQLSDSMVSHLNAVYLYCTIKQGACPLVLDAILETDIAISKLGGTLDCPNLTKFWRAWLRDDYENRQQFLVKTGYLQTTAEFTTQQRPKYVQCKPTVAGVVQGSGPHASFFRERFAAGAAPRVNFEKTLRLLNALKEIPNLLADLERGA